MPENKIELGKPNCFAERIIKRSKIICKNNGVDIYKIPLIKSVKPNSTLERFIFGNDNPQTKEHRTMVVLGTNDFSQTKFINGIINFVFCVEEEDTFRFQLTDEEEDPQTNFTRIYEIHHVKGFRIPFSLTIVVIPIYDPDVSEFFRYQRIANLFLELLEDENGIQELDMICNVIIKADIINHSYLSIFGRDVVERIKNWHPSNYMSNSSWRKSIQQCFIVLANNKKTKSLSLTKEVLNVRKQMEKKVNGLKMLIDIGYDKMEEIAKAKQMLEFCETHIESNDEDEDNFTEELTEKVKLPHGMYVKNCNRCCVTCHSIFVCPQKENLEDRSIIADLNKMKANGFCSVCPDKCNMSMHSNQPFRWVYVKKETTILSSHTNRKNEAEMKWKDLKSKGRCLIEVLQSDLSKNGEGMLEHFQTTWKFIRRLNKIALYGNSFLTQKVFNFLFDAEQQLKELGFLKDYGILKPDISCEL